MLYVSIFAVIFLLVLLIVDLYRYLTGDDKGRVFYIILDCALVSYFVYRLLSL